MREVAFSCCLLRQLPCKWFAGGESLSPDSADCTALAAAPTTEPLFECAAAGGVAGGELALLLCSCCARSDDESVGVRWWPRPPSPDPLACSSSWPEASGDMGDAGVGEVDGPDPLPLPRLAAAEAAAAAAAEATAAAEDGSRDDGRRIEKRRGID